MEGKERKSDQFSRSDLGLLSSRLTILRMNYVFVAGKADRSVDHHRETSEEDGAETVPIAP